MYTLQKVLSFFVQKNLLINKKLNKKMVLEENNNKYERNVNLILHYR